MHSPHTQMCTYTHPYLHQWPKLKIKLVFMLSAPISQGCCKDGTSQLTTVLFTRIPELSMEFPLFNFLFVPTNTWKQTNHGWFKIIWSNFYFFCTLTLFLFEDSCHTFQVLFSLSSTEVLISVLSQMFPMFLIRSSMQRHRCDHILHSSSEDFEDITVTHTTVSPFPRTSPLRSLQMGSVSGFLWTPLSMHTTHPCFQKCSLPSVDR